MSSEPNSVRPKTQLTASQGEALCFQQQLGQAQQTAEQSTQKVEQYKKIVREVEEKAKKELGQVQSKVQQYQWQAKEFKGIADTLTKQQKALDLKVAQAQNEKKRMTQQYEQEAKCVTELQDRLKDWDTYHDTLIGERNCQGLGTGAKMVRGGCSMADPSKLH